MNRLTATMMTNSIELVYGYVANDTGTWVDSSGNQTAVKFLWYDSGGEGVVIDDAGIQVNGARDSLWRKRDLTRWNITIDPTGYLLDADGNRWDIAEKSATESAMVPLKGIHNLLGIRFRLSLELNEETPTDEDSNRVIEFVDD